MSAPLSIQRRASLWQRAAVGIPPGSPIRCFSLSDLLDGLGRNAREKPVFFPLFWAVFSAVIR
jgi:hypothetical protein